MSSNPTIDGNWEFSYLSPDFIAGLVFITFTDGSFEGGFGCYQEPPNNRAAGGSLQPAGTYQYPDVCFSVTVFTIENHFTFKGVFVDDNTIVGELTGYFTGSTTLTRQS